MRSLALGVGALVWALMAGCSSSPEGVPGSFYLEATITVIDDRDDVPYAETQTRVKWWSESVDRWRWELEQDAIEDREGAESFSVSDGEAVWFYDADDNSYQRASPFELPPEFTAMPFPSVILFGPANHPDLDALAADYLTRDPEAEVFVAGTEDYLDTDATLLDYRPTWREGSGVDGASGGVGRMWVDEAHMFVLRHELDGRENRQYALVEVTRVEHAVTFDEDRFEFTPPAGAIERPAGAAAAPSSSP